MWQVVVWVRGGGGLSSVFVAAMARRPKTPVYGFLPGGVVAVEPVGTTRRSGVVAVDAPGAVTVRRRLTRAAWRLWRRTGAVPLPEVVALMAPATLARWPKQWPPPVFRWTNRPGAEVVVTEVKG